MTRVGLTCRHDITPRSSCKLCKAEDDLMRRPHKPHKPRLSAREANKLLVELNRRWNPID
jgi:hypothetical protein